MPSPKKGSVCIIIRTLRQRACNQHPLVINKTFIKIGLFSINVKIKDLLSIVIYFGFGALPGKMLLVTMIEN